MTFQSGYEKRPLAEEIGEATLRLDHVRDDYLILFDGWEDAGGHYEAAKGLFPLKHDGDLRTISGQLYALVPQYPGGGDPDDVRRVDLGRASALHYVEDRVLRIDGPADPSLDEDARVQLSELFDRYARRHFPEATTLFRTQSPRVVEYVGESALPRLALDSADERVLRRLGYRLLSENRRRAAARHGAMSVRTWAK